LFVAWRPDLFMQQRSLHLWISELVSTMNYLRHSVGTKVPNNVYCTIMEFSLQLLFCVTKCCWEDYLCVLYYSTQ
jgi:hypothetical protein